MKKDRKPILCLDFDGVLHSYESRWQGPRDIPDPPVPGALDFLQRALKQFEVHIFSSRSRYFGGRAAMKAWLRRHYFKAFGHDTWSDDEMAEIRWPKVKPPATVTLDDRAVTFTGVFPTIEELKAFRPWNRQ